MRYIVLRCISVILKVLGLLALISSIHIASEMNQGASFPYATIQSLITLVFGIPWAVFLWSRGEEIMVSIDTESNTRRTAALLQELVDQRAGVSSGEYERTMNGMWSEPPQRVVPPRQGPPPPRRWIDEQRN